MLLESLVVLATMFANVSVPVVPDPNYLQELYPSSTPVFPQNTIQAPVQQQQSAAGITQPTDIAGLVSLAVTAGLGYFMQRQKTVTDRRTYMAADTSVKLAENDQASDAKVLNMAYAMTCMADIMGKYHKEDMETYITRDGVSLWTYIETLNLNLRQDFQSRYISNTNTATTGTQSSDKVVATFNKVQQSVTPSTITPNTSTASSRPQINKQANETYQQNTSQTEGVGTDTD